MSREVTGGERDIVIACLASDEDGPYNIPVFVRFDEPVDGAALAVAAASVLTGSPTLRRTYRRTGRVITAQPATQPVVVERLHAQEGELADLAAARRIPVLGPTLVHAAVVDVDGGATRLFVNVHHALADGISLTLILRAILQTYLTGEVAIPAEPVLDAAPIDAAPIDPVPVDRPAIDEPVERAASERFLAALRGRQTPGSGVQVVRVPVTAPTPPTFAASLTAAIPALAAWLSIDQVVVNTAVAGRSLANLRALGNFVRLEPLAFDLSDWGTTPKQTIEEGMTRLATRLAVAAGAQRHTSEQESWRTAIGLGVIVDYKRESLVPHRIHPQLAGYLEEDPGYQDVKYDLHFSIYQRGSTQELTVIGRDLPRESLRTLAEDYASRLVPARPRTDIHHTDNLQEAPCAHR